MCTRICVALEVLDDSPTRIGIVMEVDDSPKNEVAGDREKEENKKVS
jgi:hypothetical protein